MQMSISGVQAAKSVDFPGKERKILAIMLALKYYILSYV